MELITQLEKVGLSDKEAKVYLATLELAQATAQEISKKSGVNRTTTYVILHTLIKKGLTSSFLQDEKTYYVAEDPEVLLSLYSLQEKIIEQQEEMFQEIFANIKSVFQQSSGHPTVRFFEGKDGLIEMSDDFIFSGADQSFNVFSVDDLKEVFSDEERRRMARARIQKDIKVKAIYTYSGDEKVSPAFLTETHGEKIKISKKKYPITCDIALYNNRVRIVSLGKRLSGVIIEDEEIHRTLSSLFQLAWECAQSEKVNDI